MRGAMKLAAVAGAWWLYQQRRRSGGNTGPNRPLQGRARTPRTQALEAGARLLQRRDPLRAFNTYLNGFHFYAGDQGRQMEAHHYCTSLNEDVIQCVIFDGNTRDARLIGVEYIISAALFGTLDPEEQQLWHSHAYEVTGGSLAAPGIPPAAEDLLMRRVMNTYGKVFHTWDTASDALPVGVPQLMMAFTADGQLRPELVADRDRRLGISHMDNRRRRSSFRPAPPAPGADSWQDGRVIQLDYADRSQIT